MTSSYFRIYSGPPNWQTNTRLGFRRFLDRTKDRGHSGNLRNQDLKQDTLEGMIENYHFTGKEPLSETIVEALN